MYTPDTGIYMCAELRTCRVYKSMYTTSSVAAYRVYLTIYLHHQQSGRLQGVSVGVSIYTTSSVDVQGVSLSTASSVDEQL